MSVLSRAKTWEISESDDDIDSGTKFSVKGDQSEQVPVSRDSEDGATSGCEDKNLPPSNTTIESRPKSPLSDPRSGTPSPAKTRRSKEEVEAERQRMRKRREAREIQRAARAQERLEKRQQSQRRRDAAELLRSLRPENCVKSLTVCIHPALLQRDGSDVLLDTLATFDWRCSIKNQPLPHSITWTRELPQAKDGEGTVEEEQVVQVLDLTQFLDTVMSVKKLLERQGAEPEEDSVLSPLLKFLSRNTEKVVTVLVTDCQRDYRTNPGGGYKLAEMLQSRLDLKDVDVEEVLVYLQLSKNISLVLVEGWQEVTNHVCAVTKALSKRPFKRLTEQTELPFCVDGSWASGVRVERDGSGLIQVWSRQIQQLNRVSSAVASAVTAAYPSPRLLLQAYGSLGSEEERKGLLAGLLVKSKTTERRIGPEISSRIYRCFTCQNPQLVLD
ncbi:essential meiotic structure-specific endonuclease subunit 2 [Aulostomus maculatus]